ncbi:hypothetical protein D3218_06640 [Aureimonas flava]|uniref:Uncharacterized protein n=1 Tax=Aureimonas flava TaxID=2320271 RepID=A0A3A1WL15_9HYPH|nr:hypothetical protein [Aureimonas flava]RIY01988.1 hypothetical protein D3218_06640 [Aureimonas flava]
MPFQPSLPSHPLAGTGVERRFLGLSRHPGTGHARRPGEVWLVFHGDWTGIYRLDPRDGRTVHLERALDGDRRRDAALWAVETFKLAPAERADARVLTAANHPGAADAAPERRIGA